MRLPQLLPARRELQPDGFVLEPDNPLTREHLLVDDVIRETRSTPWGRDVSLERCRSGRRLLAEAARNRLRLLMAAIERADHCWENIEERYSPVGKALRAMILGLLTVPVAETERDLVWLLERFRVFSVVDGEYSVPGRMAIIRSVAAYAEKQEISADIHGMVMSWRGQMTRTNSLEARIIAETTPILGEHFAGVPDATEPWALAALGDLAELTEDAAGAWLRLLAHAVTASSSRPSASWTKKAVERLAEVGAEDFAAHVACWFPLAAQRPDETFHPWNADVLKGLAWMCGMVDDERLPAAVGRLAEAAFHKVAGIGARSAKVGNACVFTLSAMPPLAAVGQLERLRQRVKTATAQELIERAFQTAADSAGLTREEIAELAAPTGGLTNVGYRREEVGDCVAEIVVGLGKPAWAWSRNGKPLRSVPASVKQEHADELKAVKALINDLGRMLPAQRDRVERLLMSESRWPYPIWRERYLDHPLVGTIARRLIWRFEEPDGRAASGIWRDGHIVDAEGRALDWPSAETTVSPWHPISAPPESVLRWRVFLEESRVVQPFKQAHREIYLLTDAELETGTYSNRFAAHVLRQHQFSALCRQRGWRYILQGGFDAGDQAARIDLPAWGLKAEFWTDAGAPNEADMTEAGISLYISTDQVRFTTAADQPARLSEIPALVFSEVMRDVDLFVGVASVGNDPAWSDQGDIADARNAYWRRYAFGDLGLSAQTRYDVLSRLVPRMTIADRCSLPPKSKFLIVRGDLRTYKIHLGSGNILMEPNDEYLCIVPGRAAAMKSADTEFLPFEGDHLLSVIISKALMLADDRKITDETITRQIGKR